VQVRLDQPADDRVGVLNVLAVRLQIGDSPRHEPGRGRVDPLVSTNQAGRQVALVVGPACPDISPGVCGMICAVA